MVGIFIIRKQVSNAAQKILQQTKETRLHLLRLKSIRYTERGFEQG